jgi:hypothetical protein
VNGCPCISLGASLPTGGRRSPTDLAKYLLKLDFPPDDHARYEQLSERAQQGILSQEEEAELDDLLTANDILMILQSKARLSLKRQNPAA